MHSRLHKLCILIKIVHGKRCAFIWAKVFLLISLAVGNLNTLSNDAFELEFIDRAAT